MNPLEQIFRPDFYPHHAQWTSVLAAARDRVGRHGDLPRWQAALDALPDLQVRETDLLHGVRIAGPITAETRRRLETALCGLHPWRKGPFDLFDVHIDTEWRSDWKWLRVREALGDLSGQRVLDVGCGNGYFGWRALGAGATSVLGVDPAVLFFLQHLALCRYLSPAGQNLNILLPIPFEILPVHPFDLVLSMGVIYHRSDPLEHLAALHRQTAAGGRLLLESLIVLEGDDLRPADAGGRPGRGRYARMRNVHVVPRLDTLTRWLAQAGFTDIETIDVSRTSTAEQRATGWMTFESLAESLDARDPHRTVEGYPAPVRAAVLARRA